MTSKDWKALTSLPPLGGEGSTFLPSKAPPTHSAVLNYTICRANLQGPNYRQPADSRRWLSSFLSLGAASLGLKRAQRAPTPLVFHWFLYPSIPTFLSTHCVPGSTQGAEGEVEDLGLSSQAQGHNGLQAKWNLGQTMNGDRLSLPSCHPLNLGIS